MSLIEKLDGIGKATLAVVATAGFEGYALYRARDNKELALISAGLGIAIACAYIRSQIYKPSRERKN